MDSGKRRIYTKASGKLGKGIRKMKEITKDIIRELILVYPALTPCQKDILTATELLIGSYENGGKLLVCGNGGSAADSLHIVGELMKSFCNKRILPKENRKKLSEYGEDGKRLADSLQGALPAVSLINESSLSTAFLNDVNPEMVFAQQVFGLGKKGDILLGISTSGNAKNVHYASIAAKSKELHVLSLTGKDGGLMQQISDVTITVPESETYKIQELHLPIYHAICRALECEFFGK